MGCLLQCTALVRAAGQTVKVKRIFGLESGLHPPLHGLLLGSGGPCHLNDFRSNFLAWTPDRTWRATRSFGSLFARLMQGSLQRLDRILVFTQFAVQFGDLDLCMRFARLERLDLGTDFAQAPLGFFRAALLALDRLAQTLDFFLVFLTRIAGGNSTASLMFNHDLPITDKTTATLRGGCERSGLGGA